MKVYRVEHKECRIGPYQGGAIGDNADYWDANHPGPREDGIKGWITWNDFFGFKNPSQLLAWFNIWDLWRWKKKGFCVYRYDIPDEHVRLGGHQVVFVRAFARSRQQVKWFPLSS